jgi:hypothetical protein
LRYAKSSIPIRLRPSSRSRSASASSATRLQIAPTVRQVTRITRAVGWLRRRHPKRNWSWLRRTYLKERWPAHNGVELFNPVALGTSRYRYRGAQIPLPWTAGYVALRDHATAMDYLEGLIAR